MEYLAAATRSTGNLSSPSGIITKRELPVLSDSGDLFGVAQNVDCRRCEPVVVEAVPK